MQPGPKGPAPGRGMNKGDYRNVCRQDRKIKAAVAALALALTLVAGTGLSALAAPEDGAGEGSSEPTVTTSQPADSGESSSRPASSDEPDSSSSEEEESSSEEDSSSRASSEEEEESSSEETTTTSREEEQSSREEETVTSRRTTTSRSGGTLTPDESYEDPEFEDISWGAQYVEETSMPETVSTAGPTAKDISDYYAIAMRWIWLPILLICASLFGLIAVNYRAHKQKKAAMQKAAGRGRTADIPMTSGRRSGSPAEDDDDVFIASDSHMRAPSARTGTGRRTSAAHAKKRVRRPRD